MLVFSQPDLAADGEVKSLSFLGLALLILLGSLGYALHRLPEPWRGWSLSCSLVPIILGPLWLLHLHGPFHSKMAHFAISFFGVVAGFRWLELLCKTGPPGFDRSLKNFVVYFASPAEVLFEDGKLKASEDGLVSELLLRIAKHMLIGTFVLSIGRATDFAPFLDRDPVRMPWLGFPRALPSVYLQTLFTYCTLATAMLMHRLLPALFGVASVDSMRSPLLLSTSLRDFWGRRWNLVVHRLMKRSFFMPLAGVSQSLGGLLAFLMSGLFHEYMWLAVNWHDRAAYVPGLGLSFFLIQFGLCSLEAQLSTRPLGKRLGQLPALLRTAMTTCAILPFGPLFLQGIHPMGIECSRQGQTILLVNEGDVVSGSPPLDWLMCGLVGLLASAHGVYRSRGIRAKRAHVVAVLPTCEGA